MYLNNKKLMEIVDDMIAPGDNPDYPFEPSEQVRVCSIDIRVDHIFWETRKQRRSVDLGSSQIFEISPQRLWKKVVLEPNGYIDLKPGEMILGRTYERISMPTGFVGKINTRSSYARLGLSTACNCDLVNPGYEGHVPMELTNTTPNSFRIRPYLPLCQLFVMPLKGGADESYNSERYASKYMDDEGGPSVWWRDALVRKISSKVFQNQLSDRAVGHLRTRFEVIDDKGLYRLEKLMDSKSWASSEELLAEFGRREKRSERANKIWDAAVKLFSAGMFIPSVIQLQRALEPSQGPDTISFVIWGLFGVSLPFAFFQFFRAKKSFYTDEG